MERIWIKKLACKCGSDKLRIEGFKIVCEECGYELNFLPEIEEN